MIRFADGAIVQVAPCWCASYSCRSQWHSRASFAIAFRAAPPL